jgi:amino acid adenylation domain-containing protein
LTAATAVSLFERTANRQPDSTAVSDEQGTISYRRLSELSDDFARMLRSRGLRRGDRAAVYLERGTGLFVALLGVLKAAGSYVAVDPRYPDSRRDLMITRSRARIVVTQPGWRDRIERLGADVVEFSGEPAGAGADPGPLPDCVPEDEAAVLFTSGSSGTPKAIALEHRNLDYLAHNSGLAALGQADRVGQVSSVSFDAFHIEMWCAFAGGAEIVVLPTMAELISRDLQRELRRRRITAMLAPTMAVNHVVHEDRDAFACLRVLYTGGDVLQPVASREILASAFSGDFYNLYGPSEAATACSSYLVSEETERFDTVPIGQPLTGARLYVLDKARRVVPDGTVGELHIGGAGVARGYLDQPGLTADRFRPDASGPPGGRMYATGDLAMRNKTGFLEFRGRADEQVKIRGYRVEPKEAERVLLRHPALLDAAVLAAGEAHDRRLVAVVVLRERIPVRQVRDWAAAELPDYLVPSSFIPVAEIPGNEHGKRDMERLSALAEDDLRRRHDWVAPRDAAEEYLAGVWADLLSAEWIGATDDFFYLGGNSMLGFRLQRRIKRDLSVDVEMREVLENSQLSALAAVIRNRQASPAGSAAAAGGVAP